MSEAFVFHTYIYLIIKAVLRREPAKKEFDRAVKAVLEYNPSAFTLFQNELFKLIEIDSKEKINETNIPKS